MDDTNLPENPDGGFRSGYVALVGRPNVGKSTLLNRLVGQKLAIVTPKPQTTRRRVVGIWSDDTHQMIFLDTPGLIRPRYRLQSFMLQVARSAVSEADVILALHDATDGVDVLQETLHESAKGRGRLIVALNKIDLIKKERLLPMIDQLSRELADTPLVPVSALRGENVEALWDELREALPIGPPYYPPEAVTEHPERFFVAEIVREQILFQFRDEVPYATEVEVERFEESPGRKDEIDAVIYVERPSQKGILIGNRGAAIKALGIAARAEIEAFLERPVVLKLFVKVVPGWRRDARALRRMGFMT